MDKQELKDFGCDTEDGTSVAEEEEALVEDQARKKARMSPLHRHHVAPLSLLVDAVEEKDGNFNVTGVGQPFGKYNEAYVRSCYEEIVHEIFETREKFRQQTRPVKTANLFVVGGSSGIGKSTFLAYFIVRLRGRFRNIAVCYAPKASRALHGTPHNEEVICVVWKGTRKIIEGTYPTVRSALVEELPNLDLIVMDGCSMPFVNVEKFAGTVIVAASPSFVCEKSQRCDFLSLRLHHAPTRRNRGERYCSISWHCQRCGGQ